MYLAISRLDLSAKNDPLPVSFIFIMDSVAQESDETFTLTLGDTDTLVGYTIRSMLQGTILDDDSKLTFLAKTTDFSTSFQVKYLHCKMII